MSTARAEVAYNGEALVDGKMDVRDFAPALLALGALIERSNRVLNEERANVEVKLRLDEKPGSFPFTIEVTASLAQQVSALVGPAQVLGAAEIIQVLGLGVGAVGAGVGLIQLLIMLKDEKIQEVKAAEDGQAVQVTGDGNTTVVAQAGAVMLFQDPGVRQEAERLVRPLRREGIDRLEVREEGAVVYEVTKDDAQYFKTSPEDTASDLSSGEFTDWVTVRKSWTVEPQRKWQFANSTAQPFNATITDEEFWARVERDEIWPTRHAKFKVRVEWQEDPSSDAPPEYRVLEVLEYVPAKPGGQGELLRAATEPPEQELAEDEPAAEPPEEA